MTSSSERKMPDFAAAALRALGYADGVKPVELEPIGKMGFDGAKRLAMKMFAAGMREGVSNSDSIELKTHVFKRSIALEIEADTGIVMDPVGLTMPEAVAAFLGGS